MTLGHVLDSGIKKLQDAAIDTARLDCLVLLEDLLKKDRGYILTHPEIEISDELNTKFTQALQRRASHEPLAYIRGQVEFYGREFHVNRHVLVPRPETETMIELFKLLPLPSPSIADIGSGSGAIGITAALERPTKNVHLYDLDSKTHVVSSKNAARHKVRAQFYESDLLTKSTIAYDVIFANLPYVPDGHSINDAAKLEPKIAIFGGTDGLAVYRRLFKQIHGFKWKSAYILTEALPFQHPELQGIAEMYGYHCTKTDDFIQQFEPN